MTIDNEQLTIIETTDVPGFGRRCIENIPTSEIVGNGLCAVPGNVAETTCVDKQNHPPDMSFRPERKRSGGIHPSSNYNLRKVKLAAWEDPSTPFHFGRDDISVGDTIQPHRLYSECSGRQIAAPTVMYHVFCIFRTQYRDRHIKQTVKQNKFDVGAAICRPPRFEYNLYG